MIVTEYLLINGKTYTRTYSDEHRYVVREGVEYEEALDPSEFGRMYTEGDIIPDEEEVIDDGGE